MERLFRAHNVYKVDGFHESLLKILKSQFAVPFHNVKSSERSLLRRSTGLDIICAAYMTLRAVWATFSDVSVTAFIYRGASLTFEIFARLFALLATRLSGKTQN